MLLTKREVIEKLYHYHDVAYDHHMFETVLSDPVDLFEQVMFQAAKMIETGIDPNTSAKMDLEVQDG